MIFVVEDRFGRTLALAFKAMRECLDRRMAEHGGSLATWLVLHHAMEGPAPSQSQLAGRLAIEAPTLVRHLDRLEADGLVERRRDDRDRRILRVRVTPAGRRAEAALRGVADTMNAELRALLGDDHVVVERALEQIREYSRDALAQRKQHAAAQ